MKINTALKAVALGTAIALSGCAQMMNIGQVSETQSKFDNSRRVTMSPAMVWTAEGTEQKPALPVMIGAAWTSAAPDVIQLTATHKGHMGGGRMFITISSMDFNADGEIIRGVKTSPVTSLGYERLSATTAAVTTSEQNFVFTRTQIEKILSAQRTVIQVQTSAGAMEGIFSNTLHETHTAKYGLMQMMQKL